MKKASEVTVSGRQVELKDGTVFYIQGWGVSDIANNIETFSAIFRDFGKLGEMEMTEELQGEFIQKQMNRIVRLIDSAVVESSMAFSDVRGVNNILKIVTAVIEENELFEALGKATGLIQMVTTSVRGVTGAIAGDEGSGGQTSARQTT